MGQRVGTTVRDGDARKNAWVVVVVDELQQRRNSSVVVVVLAAATPLLAVMLVDAACGSFLVLPASPRAEILVPHFQNKRASSDNSEHPQLFGLRQ